MGGTIRFVGMVERVGTLSIVMFGGRISVPAMVIPGSICPFTLVFSSSRHMCISVIG